MDAWRYNVSDNPGLKMEIDELFSGQTNKGRGNNKTDGKRFVSFVDDLVFGVWTYGFKHNFVRHNLAIEYTDLAGSARLLRDGITDLGILSAIELARIKEGLQVIPGMAVSTHGTAGLAQLFFKRGLKDISRVAVRNTANTSLILLKILMREKYASNPEYIFLDADLEQMLYRADAALIIGRDAVNLGLRYQNHLDLGEEWYDLTGLPFVFSFYAGRKFILGKDDIEPIRQSFNLGTRNIEKICKEYAEIDNVVWSTYHDFISKIIKYQFSELDHDGLNEFYNYAFFFGYIDQIPDVNFLNSGV